MSVHDLQAPKTHGAVLAAPPLDEAGRLLEANRYNLDSAPTELLGRPLPMLRSLARHAVLLTAQHYLAEADQRLPEVHGRALLLAGHQPDLFHPGVWLKNFVLARLARAHGAIALNLIVDNDTAKNTLLNVPAGDHVAQVPFDHWQSEVPFEERAALDEALFRSLPERVAPLTSTWGFTPLLDDFWAEACRQGKRTPLLGERFAAARRVFERRWGCTNVEVPLSRVCQTEAFAWFACHLLHELPRFHEIYNSVVAAYRTRYGVRSRHHPVPDLVREGEWLEAPFWAWRTGGKRRERLLVRRGPDGFALRAGPETWPMLRGASRPEELVGQWQSFEGQGCKVRTRALTTTLFARFFVGDLFVHGLGGGKYDELTDEILRRFYDVEPPAYLVLTGTLLLPFARPTVSDNEQRRLQTLTRDLWWNPQRHLQVDAGHGAKLTQEKQRWIGRTPATPGERRERFETLRKLTSALRPHVHDADERARRDLERTNDVLRAWQALGRRDYAFCLYPEEELRHWLGA